ncbi:hypothetical protein BDZ89DRAFT_282127 [Hymenopellis radicata]|nr:hypothetical protein BDZ89DRAFT_282127 [Hymenopellis radicata]
MVNVSCIVTHCRGVIVVLHPHQHRSPQTRVAVLKHVSIVVLVHIGPRTRRNCNPCPRRASSTSASSSSSTSVLEHVGIIVLVHVGPSQHHSPRPVSWFTSAS